MSDRILLDANAILRYLLDDNHEQHLKVLEIIQTKDCYCIISVIQETVYVLNGYYSVSRETIKTVISSLTKVISIDDSDVLLKALEFFVESPKLDFIDCILCGFFICRKIGVFSFDKKLNNKLIKLETTVQ